MNEPQWYDDPLERQEAIETAQAAIPRVMAENPDLAASGWNHSGHNFASFRKDRLKMQTEAFARQVATAWLFVRDTYLEHYGSYTIKHEAERWAHKNGLEPHVSNGALITAAIMLGYKPKREKDGPNCTFKMRGMSDWRAANTPC